MDQIKAAIVGCGAIAAVHAAALKAMEDVRVIGCADIRKERAEKMAADLGCEAYDSLTAMLQAQQPDVLHICTPHYLHVPMALEAAKRGIAVLSEKPEGISPDQLEALAAAEKAGARIGICFQNRYNQSVQQAKEILATDEAGAILGARAFVTWHREAPYYTESGWRGKTATEGGGVMINQAIHTLDLMQYLCGFPKTVSGRIANYHLQDAIEVEDTAHLYMRLADGTPLIMFATTAYAVDAPIVLEIVCERVLIHIEGDGIRVTDRLTGLALNAAQQNAYARPKVGKSYWGNGHPSLFRDYYDRLIANEPFPINAQEGAKAVKLLLALYESSASGQAVAL